MTFDEAYNLQKKILNGELNAEALMGTFEALDAKGAVTQDELRGFFKASQEVMTNVDSGMETLDTCGTGGGGASTFNISTAAAIVCAAAGVPVAKHGNRAATSLCGSADVLEELGIPIDLAPDQVRENLKERNFAFMYARSYHPAFKFAAEARKSFGKRTYFNLLGPLLNPARSAYRIHGFADEEYISMLGDILIESGVRKAWLFHSSDGMDEISPFKPTNVYEFSREEKSKKFLINPSAYGFGRGRKEDIRGGDSAANALIIKSIFEKKASSAQAEAVILNAAAGLVVFGRAADFAHGIAIAGQTINSGQALDKLKELQVK